MINEKKNTNIVPPMISIVVPVYREERSIAPFLSRLEPVMETMGITYEVIFSLDPSPDRTEEIILREINRNPAIKLLVFSRRFGQPAATMAGILCSTGNTCVTIDVDLQDQPELIEQMYSRLKDGYEVVYAKRRSRKGETWVKRLVSYLGYFVINRLSDVEIPRDTGDFRIMTRRVIEELRSLNESHGFLRGLVAYVGFKQTFIEYDRDERFTDTGKYNRLIGSLKIGVNGLVGFSSRPLQLMSFAGSVFAGISFFLGVWYLVKKLMGASLPLGFPTTLLAITFFSGVQLLGLGLIGEYIGRIYDEVKHRPQSIVDRKINFDE